MSIHPYVYTYGPVFIFYIDIWTAVVFVCGYRQIDRHRTNTGVAMQLTGSNQQPTTAANSALRPLALQQPPCLQCWECPPRWQGLGRLALIFYTSSLFSFSK
jgi:hypothetical protein